MLLKVEKKKHQKRNKVVKYIFQYKKDLANNLQCNLSGQKQSLVPNFILTVS